MRCSANRRGGQGRERAAGRAEARKGSWDARLVTAAAGSCEETCEDKRRQRDEDEGGKTHSDWLRGREERDGLGERGWEGSLAIKMDGWTGRMDGIESSDKSDKSDKRRHGFQHTREPQNRPRTRPVERRPMYSWCLTRGWRYMLLGLALGLLAGVMGHCGPWLLLPSCPLASLFC